MFIPVHNGFNYNTELALKAHQRICHGTYIQSDGNTYAIFKDGEPCQIKTRSSVDVYICLDGSRKVHYNDQWYELKKIERAKLPKLNKPKLSAEELSKLRSENAKRTNTPWRRSNSLLFTRRGDIFMEQKG